MYLFYRIGTDIVVNAGRKQCRSHLHCLKQHLNEILAKVRQTLATKITQDDDGGLVELQAMLIMPIIEKVKGVLQDLSVCIFYTKIYTEIFEKVFYFI